MTSKGWRKVPLANIATIQTGIAKGAKKIKDPVEIPYLRVANVQDGFLDLTEVKTIEVDRTQIERYLLRNGDVLLTEGGDFDKLGRGSVWRGEVSKCVHQNHVFVVRPNPKVLLPEYLSILTGSSYGKSYFLRCSKQSTNLASINSTQLKAFPVLLPPISEQSAIVETFSHWDQAISKLELLIATKEIQYIWLQTNLIKKANKAEWQRAVLGDLCAINKGQQLNKLNMTANGSFNVVNGGISPSGRTNKWNAPENTITISEGGNSCGFVNFITEKFWNGGHCYTVQPTVEDVDKPYLFFYLKTYEKEIMRLRVGSGLPNIQIKDISSFPVLCPSYSEQKRIADVLTMVTREISLLEKQRNCFIRQKVGLMQKLFTGYR